MIFRPFTLLLILLCIVSVLVRVSAQSSREKSFASVQEKSETNKTSSLEEADLLSEVRRTTVLALVSSLADEARDYSDETLRVRVQARAAEVLCDTERERARSLFYRAWEAGDAVDRAGERLVADERKRLRSGQGGPSFIPLPPNLRLEVLRFAARCDRELSEKFLASLEEEKKAESIDATSNLSQSELWDPTEPPSALNKRLELGIVLLESGDVESALRFADPALVRVTKPGIVFLYKLRQKDVAAADERYAGQLSRSEVDPFTDANTISLLSTFAFSPLIFATVTHNGRAYGGEAAPPPVLPAELYAAFFRIAAQVLLRPLAPPDQDRTSAGRAGTYFVIARLLPLFQQYAPDRVPELSAHLVSLTQDAPAALRDDYSMRTAGLTSESATEDNSQAIQDQLHRVSSSAERDRLYVSALRGITKTDPKRARDIADKIENADLRKRAIAFVDFAAIRVALDKRDAEEALRITRAGNLPSVQRVWAYTEIAQLLGTDPVRVIQLLNEATAEARRIDQRSPQRAQALTAIATRFLDVDRTQAWETIAEVVKAASHADSFKGEAGRITAHLQTGSMVATFDLEVPSFDLGRIFSILAKDDLQRTIDLARRFTGEEARAIAILVIARSVLAEKPKIAGPRVPR